jgi:hypothetical protein
MDLTSAEVKQAWNAMCKINTHMIGELQQLAALQQEQGFKLVIASTTNAEHNSFIQNLLQQNGIVFDPNNTFYGLSHLEHTLDNKTLAESGLNAAGVDINNANILSLHNAIPIGTQIPTDTRKASLTQAICGHFNYRDKGLVELDLEKEDEVITLIPQQTTGKFVAQVQKQRQEAKTNCCGCTLF